MKLLDGTAIIFIGIQWLQLVYKSNKLTIIRRKYMAVTQGIKLDDDTSKRLKKLSLQRNRSAHWLMRDAIERYLTEEERYERERIEDLAEYEDYLQTGRGISQEEMSVWLEELIHDKNAPWPKQK